MNGERGAHDVVRVVVSLGTDHHHFDRLLRWVATWLEGRTDVECFVQHGATALPPGLTGDALLPHDRMLTLLRGADVVVVQGGPGSIMDARACGVLPIAVPRTGRLHEVVDDHQVAFVHRMHDEGLVLSATTEPELHRLLDAAAADPSSVSIEPDSDNPVEVVARFGEWVDELVRAHPPRRHVGLRTRLGPLRSRTTGRLPVRRRSALEVRPRSAADQFVGDEVAPDKVIVDQYATDQYATDHYAPETQDATAGYQPQSRPRSS